MKRRRKLGLYGVVVGVCLSSLFWYATTPDDPYSIAEDDVHGVERIYPGDQSYGARKQVIYPTKKASPTATFIDMLTDTAATARMYLKLTNKNVKGMYARDNIDGKPDDLPKKEAHVTVDRPRSAANQPVYGVQKTPHEVRRTRHSVSVQPTDPVRRFPVVPSINITSYVQGTNVVEYPTRPPQSRMKQVGKYNTQRTEHLSITSKQANKQHDIVVKRTAQVYETINLNADNSRKFAKILLPIKGRSNGSETSKNLEKYPTRPPQSRIKLYNKRTSQTHEDLLRTARQPNTDSEVEVRRTSPVNGNVNLNADNSRKFANVLVPIKGQSNANETSKKPKKYQTGPEQSKIKQYSQQATQPREDLLRTSKQPNIESEVEVKRTAVVNGKLDLNADNSRKFANIALPVKRQSNSSDTSKKLVEYPTRIPRSEVDAMFRLQARKEADTRARTTETREERAPTTSRGPAMLPGVRATGRRIRLGAGGTAAALEGENVVSMSVYGSAPRYMAGVMRNAELVRENFPGWKLRVYTEVPSDTPRYGVVPQTVLERLRALGTDIYFMDPREETIPPMMWRFLVADDMSVDRFIVRDADSRLTERDAAAVRAWVASGKPFNCIRDHPSHAQYAVSGGMWGGKPAPLKYILRKSWRELMRGSGKAYLQDMMFLIQVIWPKVEAHAYCSDSVSCDVWSNAHPFPVPRYGYDTVGQVVNEHEMGRIGDIQILRRAGENRKCSPKIADLT